MVLCEDRECGVCYLRYCRSERVPRVLHCAHTFCAPCLETMAQSASGLLTVRCPLCRRVTCVGRGLGLQEALWVNSRLWDRIPEAQEEEEDGEDERGEEEDEREEMVGANMQTQPPNMQTQPPTRTECPVSKHYRPRLRLPSFLRKLSLTRQPQERIVPGCNVEMKSWRRLSTEEAF